MTSEKRKFTTTGHDLGEVYILLRMECEYKCKVCPYWGTRGACRDAAFREKYGGEPDTARIKGFIDQVCGFKPRTITLSGGEPLQSDVWIDIAAYAKQKNLNVSLSTNALHVPVYYDEILQYVDNIQVSLGGTKDIIGKVRESAFGFDEVIQGLAALSEKKKILGRRRPFVRIIYVISHLSYEKIGEFHDLLQDREVGADEIYFQHVMYIDEPTLQRHRKMTEGKGRGTGLWDGFLQGPGRIDFEKLFRQMDRLERLDHVTFSPMLTRDEIRMYYDPRKKGSIRRKGHCTAPWNQVDLYPNGDVMICPDLVIGNIHEKPFSRIWNGKKARWLRKAVIEKKRFPGCASCFYYYVSLEEGR